MLNKSQRLSYTQYTFSLALLISAHSAFAEVPNAAEDSPNVRLRPAFEEWSAFALSPGSFSLGTTTGVGVGEGVMLGFDPTALALGVRTAEAKWQLPIDGTDAWSIGLKYAWFNRRGLYSESIRSHFDELDGRYMRPSVAWSNQLSSRLTIHSFWATGFGKAHAVLSDFGKRQLWKAKHGDDTYPGDQPTTSSSTTGNKQIVNQDGDSTFAKRTMQLQSIAGFTEDRFQITGDWERDDGNRILLATRLERTKLESLETFSVRITIAQEWVLDHFHMRLGGGPQYAMLSGKDLDGEEIKAAGWLPAADLALFWLF
jgi:hypothetical protein